VRPGHGAEQITLVAPLPHPFNLRFQAGEITPLVPDAPRLPAVRSRVHGLEPPILAGEVDDQVVWSGRISVETMRTFHESEWIIMRRHEQTRTPHSRDSRRRPWELQ